MNTRRTLRSSSCLSNTSEKVKKPVKSKIGKKHLEERELVLEADDNNSSNSLNRRKSLSRLSNTSEKIEETQLEEAVLASKEDDGSSSDSSVGDYLKSADAIDLNSTFFKFEITTKPDFESIEKTIFSEVQRLSESDGSVNEVFTPLENEPKTINFTQLHSYSNKLEEAKKCVENYKRKSKVSHASRKEDIKRLLSIGETSGKSGTKEDSFGDSSEFESEDGMEWEEIEEKKPSNAVKIPKEGVQITVQLPNAIQHKKKKRIDFVAVVKRRINRIKKENQVFIHKVHLLCWVAHGNCVNSVLNDEVLMGLALKLLPSDKCYPPKRADISYLEQITKWFGKTMKLQERSENEQRIPLLEALEMQISKKQVWSKKYFVYICIIILRALGLECRLILSLQCLPLRPPSSELCSLSTKDPKKNEKSKSKTDSKNTNAKSSNTAKKLNSKLNVSSSKIKPSKETAKIKQKIESNKEQSKSKKPVDKSSDNKPVAKNVAKELKKSSKNSSSSNNLTVKNVVAKDVKKPKNSSSKSTKITSSQPNEEKLKISQLDGVDDEPSTSKLRKGLTLQDNKDKKLSVSKIKKADKPSKEVLKENKNHETFNSKKSKPNLKAIGANKSEEPSSSAVSKTSKPNLKTLKGNDASTSKAQKVTKPNLKALKQKESNQDVCKSQNHTRKTKIKVTDNSSSDSDFKLNSRSNVSKFSNPKKIKLDVKNDIMNLLKDEMIKKKHIESMKLVKRKPRTESDSDSDFVPELVKKRRSNSNSDSGNSLKSKFDTKVKRRIPPKSELLKLEMENNEKKKIGIDVWAEVFLEDEEKWISVDVISGHVHCVAELHNRATQPVSYILAWNNNLSLKDVTARYCPNLNTVTRKLRVDSIWWYETLKPYIGPKTARDREEDEDFARQQLDKPLPTTINEYKNHPLYVLKRHLLKFEAIYPPDAVTLGFVRNEAVYARECVYTLHSREIWVKHAKVVKPGQQPYKIVKARPKYDKLSGTVITDLPLELFGKWQVDDYVPPTAENGVVPRNAFGNVELFKSCMLPKKTVHLQLPGLNKIARKLQIDCAPAVVGFDFHAGGSHPVFDGYVVCEEFKDTLIAAWEEDQAETAKRELEKYEKRVYGNWRKLIKGLLIRERLKARYDFGLTSGKGKSKKKLLRVEKKKRRVYSESEGD